MNDQAQPVLPDETIVPQTEQVAPCATEADVCGFRHRLHASKPPFQVDTPCPYCHGIDPCTDGRTRCGWCHDGRLRDREWWMQ